MMNNICTISPSILLHQTLKLKSKILADCRLTLGDDNIVLVVDRIQDNYLGHSEAL